MSQRKEEALQKLKQKLVFRGFSSKTIKSYIYNSEKFLDYLDKSRLNLDNFGVKSH
jgi:SOS response regulatory protein OraA/RecX